MTTAWKFCPSSFKSHHKGRQIQTLTLHKQDPEDGDMDVTNPFADATEDEIASIESTLESLDREHQMVADSVEKNNVSTEEELERQTIQLGSADFDEYDASGKNPFF